MKLRLQWYCFDRYNDRPCLYSQYLHRQGVRIFTWGAPFYAWHQGSGWKGVYL